MKLPLEIKNLIYKYTFGGNVIHIIRNADRARIKFRSTVCRALISEEEAQENFDGETHHKWSVPANEGRHSCCRSPSGDGEQKPRIVRLSALRCCRQMYNEAHYVPYSANTFSCADPDTLLRFTQSLARGNHGNHLAVRSLFIELLSSSPSRFGSSNHAAWRKALAACANHLTKLNNVNISFEWMLGSSMHGARTPAEFEAKKGPQWRTPFMSDIFVLGKLPLRSATMVISDAKAYEFTYRWIDPCPDRWTLEEKQAWARYVKEMILK